MIRKFFWTFLGHGRALETYLIGVKLLFGIFILPNKWDNRIIALSDLIWWYPDWVIALPFFIIGILQLGGLIANYNGVEWSWIPRAIGAGLAIFLWVWLIVKHLELGVVVTGIMPFIVMSMLGSMWLFAKAWNRLPIPGVAGLA